MRSGEKMKKKDSTEGFSWDAPGFEAPRKLTEEEGLNQTIGYNPATHTTLNSMEDSDASIVQHDHMCYVLEEIEKIIKEEGDHLGTVCRIIGLMDGWRNPSKYARRDNAIGIDDDFEELPPSEFYFAIDVANGDNYPMCDESTLSVTLKETWDREGHWDDNELHMVDRQIEALGYERLTECVYEITDHDVYKCRQVMLKAGFTENPEIIKRP
jgi:hypothetical protein